MSKASVYFYSLLCSSILIGLPARPATAREGTLVPPGGGWTTGLENCEMLTPGFVPTWFVPDSQEEVNFLLDKLLLGGRQGLPAGVSIVEMTTQPGVDGIAENESFGYYTDFLLESAAPVSATLSIEDGIFMTTGDFVDTEDNLVQRCNRKWSFSALNKSDTSGVSNNQDDGDPDIQGLIPSVPVNDGVGLTIRFTSDPTIVGLRFKAALFSLEFLECEGADSDGGGRVFS